MTTTQWTYVSWQRHANRLLRAQPNLDGAESHSTARLLLDHVAGLNYAHLLRPDEPLGEESLSSLEAALALALSGAPLPYIVGTAHFYGRVFRCDARALIPRPETELLIEAVLGRLAGNGHARPLKIADLGTGSGCIAVTLALELSNSQIFATDVEAGPRELAATNAQALGARITILAGSHDSWTAPLAGFGPFDVIVTNPPYIPRAEVLTLETRVRDFEPRAALDGGNDGLAPYRVLARDSGPYLAQEGFLATELGAGQFEDVANLFGQNGWRVEPPLLDLQGHARVLVARFCFT